MDPPQARSSIDPEKQVATGTTTIDILELNERREGA
jgi:hypothetical protein